MLKPLFRIGPAVTALALVLSLSGFTTLEALFAPKADLWEHWATNDPNSEVVVDHGAWDEFLKTYVRADKAGLNRVAYGKVTDADRKILRSYLARLGAVPISRLKRDEQQAYWINMYNALTVRVILDHYPVASIQDIDLGPGFFPSGPWDKKLIKIDGKMVSLNDIEHRILRPIWKDPRLHYAVNCASVGCPNLQRAAFTAARTDAMLDRAASAYVNSPRGVSFNDGGPVVSKIYDWFQEDFGDSEDAVLDHLKKFATAALAARLDQATGISGYAYDWSLNDAANRQTRSPAPSSTRKTEPE
jgi:hypothetical protein